MLREWIRHLGLASLQRIASDPTAWRSPVWRLAKAELARRLVLADGPERRRWGAGQR
jgi:hypothetical protein